MLNQLTQVYIHFGQVLLVTRIKWAYFIALFVYIVNFMLMHCFTLP